MGRKTLAKLAQQATTILNQELTQEHISYTMAEVRVYALKSVGVQGDERTYAYPAEVTIYNKKGFVWKPSLLETISTRITNEIKGINRVLYVVAKKE